MRKGIAMYVSSGQISRGIVLAYPNHQMYIKNGGIAVNTTINEFGLLYVSSGGTASNTILNDGIFQIHSGGIAIITTVNGGNSMGIGGTASHTVINSGGYVIIGTTGIASLVTIQSGGYMRIHRGGIVNNITVNGGHIYISSGGTATNIRWTPGIGTITVDVTAYVTFTSNYSGVYYGHNDQLISHADEEMSDIEVDGELYVYSGGTTCNTIINSAGQMWIRSGGTANNITINGGLLYISSGCTANNTTINSGWMRAIGGTANNITVNPGGTLDVHESATDIIENGGYILIGSGANVSFIPNSFNGLILSYGQAESATVHSGTIANNTTVNNNCTMEVSSGGIANSTTVGGMMHVSSGGTANYTTVNRNLCVYNGGTANHTTVNGSMTVYSGGMAIDTTVDYFGHIRIYNGGTATNTTVTHGGSMIVSSGGTVIDTVINSYDMYVSSGGMATGTLVIVGGRVSAQDGSIVNFDLTNLKTTDVARVNNLSLINGNPSYTITIAANQAGGYLLAGGASEFSGTISIGTDEVYYGKVGVNENPLIHNNNIYKLVKSNANLFLTIGDGTIGPSVISTTSDIVATTNQNVTVRAVFSDNSIVCEYSLNNQDWQTYTDGVVFDSNGTVYFRANNATGYSDVISYTVTNIDKIAPVKPTATADIITVTNRDIIVSATFSNDTATKQYSLNGQIWNPYTTGVVMSANGRVYFRGIDEAGNISDVTEYNVTNIDKIKPTKPTASANIIAKTNKDVTVTAIFSNDSAQKQYSLNGQTWNPYTTGVVMSANRKVYFRGIDAADNISDVTEYNVTNIDKIKPAKPTAAADISAATNKDVTVSAVFSGDSAQKQYSIDNRNWSTYTSGVVMSANGKVYFRGIDAAGNISDVTSYTVSNIDKIAPTKPTATANITAPTNQNVTVSATFSGDSAQRQYSLDNQNWRNYTGGVVFSKNGTVWFRGIDAAGNMSEMTSYAVTNIDKVAPTRPTASANITTPTNQDVTVTATFSNDTATKQYSRDNSTWQTYTSGIVMSANGTLYFRGIDAVGNVSEVTSYAVTNIDKVAPTRPTASANITAATNRDVTVSAAFSSDSVQKQYSLNNTNWKTYSAGIVMSVNGSVYFRGIDTAGNISDVAVYQVTNIDKVAPTAPTASANITAKTKQNVTVTATFSNDSAQKQYSLDKRNWNAYTSGVVFTENGTVYFRGIDAAGNISGTTAYTVGNIESDEFEITGDQTGNQNIPLNNPGKYTLTGDFGDITGTVTVFNGGKKAGTGTLKNGVLTFNKGNPVLLDDSLETVIKVTVKKGTNTNYTATLGAQTVFDKGDTDSREAPRQLGNVAAPGKLVNDGWVGFGDKVDYLAFSLDHAANLSLDYTATDATKFTLYNAEGKSVMKSSLKAGTALTTKAKLLEAGTYYLEVQSTNAKKGGDANYTVGVNGATAFFTKGDNSDDVYQQAKNLGVVNSARELDTGWVGYGDVYDFKSITLNSAAKLKFTVNATDAAKLTVYQLNNGKLKSIGKVSVKANIPGVTKDIFVTAGTYYLAVQSTNAKKGGSADYSIAIDGNSEFFPVGDNTNDTWQAASAKGAKLLGEEITGWVGYGDAKDFIKFQLAAGDGQIQLDMNEVTANAYNSKQIKLTCLDANGKSVALSSFDGDTLVSKKPVLAGEYYLGVTCANVKKFNTSYSVTAGLLATA